MTEHVAPQEDQLIIPAAWTARLLPRRGRPGKPVQLKTGVSPRRRLKIGNRADGIRDALERPENTVHAPAVEAFLAGEPDPHGAAVVAALMLDENSRWKESWLRPEFDYWVEEFGLPFAVAAAVVRMGIRADASNRKQRTSIAHKVVNTKGFHQGGMLTHELKHGVLADLRSLIADLSDSEYAEVVAAVAPHRDTMAKRLSAMAILPDETEWSREACVDYKSARGNGFPYAEEVVFQSLTTPEQLAASGIDHVYEYHMDTTVMGALLNAAGPAAFPVLRKTFAESEGTTAKKTALKAIALIPTDDAMRFLLEHVNRPHVFEIAADAARRFPVRALRCIARTAYTLTPDRRWPLIAIAALVAPAGINHVSHDDHVTLDGLLASEPRVPEAAYEDLPPLLVSPPWTVKHPKVKPVVIEGLETPDGVEVRWADREQAEWAEAHSYYGHLVDEVEADWVLDRTDWRLVIHLAHVHTAKAEASVDDWLASTEEFAPEPELQRILARWGGRVAERVLKAAATDATMQELPGPILSATAARITAERYARLKSARTSAARWLDRHGLAAVPYLVPDALGAEKKPRQYAEAALHHLAINHGPESVAAEAKPYGPEAVAAITALLDGDPLEPRTAKIPKAGAWAAPGMLPQVLLKDRESALPFHAVRHLITVLALATPDYPYPGIDVVAEACDRASLARFGRVLFDRWLAVGAPSQDSWALTQLAHFAEDETVWALAPLIREWPGQNQHKRAVVGLQVLGAIGSEEAMRAVQGIADKVKFKALKTEASKQIERIAAELGLSREQLADRLVPEFGLGEASALVLDYGPRKFHVVLDETLKPYVTDEDGKPRKSLPRPGAKDDANLAGHAYQRFTALKKELRTVAADQVSRLENAMVNGRTWTVPDFRRFFVDHALAKHLARRVVWFAEDGDTRFGFRVAEDGSFSDVEEESVDLQENARIRVAHPVHLEGRVDAWAEILADYEILQPFDQLTRPVMAFTEEELATGRLTRFEGAKVDVGRILGLTKRGWERAAPEDGGMSPGISYRLLPSGGYVTAALDPGIFMGYVAEFPEQTLQEVRLSRSERFWWGEKDVTDVPTGIDPVAAAEVLGALTRLTGAA